MAPKLTIHERCQRCGERNATLVGDTVKAGHPCRYDPPGPPAPPVSRYYLDTITFIRAEWTVEELQADLDEANLLLDRWPLRYWGAASRAEGAIRQAFNEMALAHRPPDGDVIVYEQIGKPSK